MLVTIPSQFKFATLGQQTSVEMHETSGPHCCKHEISFFLHMATCCFSVRCVPSKWQQHAALKRREVSTRLYEIKSQDTVIFQCCCQFGRYARSKTTAAFLFIEAVSPPLGSAVRAQTGSMALSNSFGRLFGVHRAMKYSCSY